MQWWGYLIVGIPFAVMLFVLIVLALGPAYIQVRDWFNNRGHF